MSDVTQKEDIQKNESRKVSIRLPLKHYNEIEKFAQDNNTNVSTVLRYTIDGQLAKYLGTLRYINEEQGRQINESVILLAEQVNKTNNELRRIGNNYNQELKLMQFRKKYSDILDNPYTDISTKMAIDKKYNDMKKELGLNGALNKDELNGLMSSYKEACDNLGVALYGILKGI